MELNDKLAKLYNDDSKHSNYQNVPQFVSDEIGYSEKINEEWRGDTARYDYLINKIKEMKILSLSDIGANTGFFTLSIGYKYSNISCNAYELNQNHANHIKIIKNHFGLKNIKLFEQGIYLSNILEMEYSDVVINLNVLHHAGVDFDINLVQRIEDFESYAIKYLSRIKSITKFMFFQIGYNWGGDKSKPLVQLGDVRKFIQWNHNIFCSSGWNNNSIAIYDFYTKTYRELNSELYKLVLMDSNEVKSKDEFNLFLEKIGFENNSEFYKRPIFLLDKK